MGRSARRRGGSSVVAGRGHAGRSDGGRGRNTVRRLARRRARHLKGFVKGCLHHGSHLRSDGTNGVGDRALLLLGDGKRSVCRSGRGDLQRGALLSAGNRGIIGGSRLVINLAGGGLLLLLSRVLGLLVVSLLRLLGVVVLLRLLGVVALVLVLGCLRSRGSCDLTQRSGNGYGLCLNDGLVGGAGGKVREVDLDTMRGYLLTSRQPPRCIS